MNIKGRRRARHALLIPMTEFSMGLDRDINDITKRTILRWWPLQRVCEHERNYDDGETGKDDQDASPRCGSHPRRDGMGNGLLRESLRNIIIGIGGKQDGF